MDIWGLLASIAISFLMAFIFAYFLFWIDRYQKEPFALLGGVFLWGAIVAAGTAFVVNTLVGLGVMVVTESETATQIATATLVAPFVEEILKALAIFLVFVVFTKNFNSAMDGLIYACVAAAGFAASENAFYIYTTGFLEEGWQGFIALSLIRIVFIGWLHPFLSAFVGIGLAVTRNTQKQKTRIIAPAIGLGLAILLHAAHNFFAVVLPAMSFYIFGWLLMLFLIVRVMKMEDNRIASYLEEEEEEGLITTPQFLTTSSAGKFFMARLKGIFSGRYRKATRFYRTAAELALQKSLRDRLEEDVTSKENIKSLREKVKSLSDEVPA